jgi:hypothetical protein
MLGLMESPLHHFIISSMTAPMRRADVAPRALCATQRRTGQIHPMVALRILAGAGGGGMTPRFFPVPI